MIWTSAVAVASSVFEEKLQRQRHERMLSTEMIAQQSQELLRGRLALMGISDGRKRQTVQSKCPCCGSHEYGYKASVRVCSYCRTPG